jgi:SAM-dependent methyltransferase
MGELVNIVTPLHIATSRDYLERMINQKVECMKVAKRYDQDYWDGDRRYGYGGYRYIPGRWKSVAECLIDRYSLTTGSRVLDAGCGKGYLLYEMALIEPGLEIAGFDISEYGLSCAKSEIKENLFRHDLAETFPCEDNHFDLVVSLGCLHNLSLPSVVHALSEVQRVGRQGYVMVESFRNEQEFFNLECWALTAETLVSVDAWHWLHQTAGYGGDFEFIFFE